jgi:hypothetical protein
MSAHSAMSSRATALVRVDIFHVLFPTAMTSSQQLPHFLVIRVRKLDALANPGCGNRLGKLLQLVELLAGQGR